MPRSNASAILRSLALTAALAVAATAFTAEPVTPPEPTATAPCRGCNVVLITFDALRADRLGAYGYAKPTSPSIDALAARSSVFLRNRSQSGSTISSVPSFLTGKLPHTDRLLDDGKLLDSEVTLAEVLSRAGYLTMAVIANRFAGCEWGFCQGFDSVDEDFAAAESAEATLARAEKMLASQEREPFFLWVHFRVPHTPYTPGRERFLAFYDGPEDVPKFYEGESSNAPLPFQIRRLVRAYRARGEPVSTYHALGGQLELTPSIVRQLGALYDGNVKAGDAALGELLESLPPEQTKRTVVVIAADHAESLGDHERVGHNTLHRDVLHTPLIVYVPGRAPARVGAPTSNVDIVPTILGALGVPAPPGGRGIDLLAGPPPPDRAIVSEYSNGQAIASGRWVLHTGSEPHLDDLENDPGETRNVAAEHPEVVRELEEKLEAIRDSVPADAADREDTPVLEKLRALGYITDDRPVE